MVEPPYAKLNMDITLSYNPKEEMVSAWHIVKDIQKENFQSIATEHGVPVARLIEFNFPGTVQNGRINPDIVNWYLFHHKRFLCRKTTRDGFNYMFGGGEKVAIPYLGIIEPGEPIIIRSSNMRFKIRMHANLNIARVVAFDFSIFEIWDEKAKLTSFYTYWGSGISKGLYLILYQSKPALPLASVEVLAWVKWNCLRLASQTVFCHLEDLNEIGNTCSYLLKDNMRENYRKKWMFSSRNKGTYKCQSRICRINYEGKGSVTNTVTI